MGMSETETTVESARERHLTRGLPRPIPDAVSLPFYEAAKRGEIVDLRNALARAES